MHTSSTDSEDQPKLKQVELRRTSSMGEMTQNITVVQAGHGNFRENHL